MNLVLLLHFLSFSFYCHCSNDSLALDNDNGMNNNEWWDNQDILLCNDSSLDNTWQYPDAICLTYLVNFHIVKLEVLSEVPGLVIYRDLFSEKQVSGYLEHLKTRQLERQQVVEEDGTFAYSKIRVANGTQIFAEDSLAVQSVLDTVRRMIPNLNFESSEEIQALSYQSGGHYGPHYDYLDYPSDREWDRWMKEFGNRFGTLIMVFQTATKGGATVFPYLDLTVRPNSGDAFFWFNARGDTEQEDEALHGGCPIYEGTKIISTIWVRMKDQPILANILSPNSIPASMLIPENVRHF